MSNPKITIITPSFNQGIFIEQTILSILNQNYPSIEYIIIDGKSTDETIHKITQYEDRISYWVSEPDLGQTDAINKGFNVATGDIINWLNSDDLLAPNSLHYVAESFQDEKIMAVTGNVTNFLETKNLSWNEICQQRASSAEFISQSFNNQPGTFFRKNIWDKYFPLPVQLKYTMDQYLWFCFWLEHSTDNFLIQNVDYAFFRRHSHSKTSSSLQDITFNSLGKGFFDEHNLIFWSYFDYFNKEKAVIISDYFSENYPYHSRKIIFPNTLLIHKNINDKIFQLYLFELLKEDYRHGFYTRFKRNCKYLQKDFFSIENWSLLKGMKLKTVSPSILSFYRSAYWKFKALSDT